MITKIVGKKTFVWDPKAFDHRGYWFSLGKRGKMGRAASRKEFKELGTPYEEELAEEDSVKGKMDYAEADRINQTSLRGNIADRINSGDAISTAIAQSISEKTKAKLVGIKKKFDPLNIVSNLTGGSPLGLALTGRLFGREPEDVEYFSKKKDPNVVGSPSNQVALQSGDALITIATKMFRFMRKSSEAEKLYYDKRKKFLDSEEAIKDARTQELVNALLGTGKFKIPKLEEEVQSTPTAPKPTKSARTPRTPKKPSEKAPEPTPTPIPIKSPAAPTARARVKVNRKGPAATRQTKGGKVPKGKKPSAKRVPLPPITGDDKSVMAMVVRHEGKRNTPYKDTLGFWTVGVGHLIGSTLPANMNRTFTNEEVENLFKEDYAVHKQAAMRIPGYEKMNAQGQAALIDLTFNMGPGWYKGWPILTRQLSEGDVEGAASNLENSKWYGQVGNRAPEIVSLIRNGIDKGAKLESMSNTNKELKDDLADTGSTQTSIINNTMINTQITNRTRMLGPTSDLGRVAYG